LPLFPRRDALTILRKNNWILLFYGGRHGGCDRKED
jgi:hypothetical protein